MFKKRLLILIFLAWSASSAQGQSPDSATALNAQGYRYYQSKSYEKALEYFGKALEKDPKHALAHYNLACTLAVLRSRGQACRYDAFPNTILEHLAASIQTDPARREKMARDGDLNSVRKTAGYQKLLGLSPENTGDFQKILLAVVWYGDGRTLDPRPLEEIQFHPGGTLTFRSRTASEINQKLVFGPWSSREGTYQIQENQIILALKKAYHHPFSSRPTRRFRVETDLGLKDQVTGNASLKLYPLEDDGKEISPEVSPIPFFDHPSECEVY